MSYPIYRTSRKTQAGIPKQEGYCLLQEDQAGIPWLGCGVGGACLMNCLFPTLFLSLVEYPSRNTLVGIVRDSQ
nr:hypothetical protein Q903MT_gene3415 [Picea sitchensis]